MTNRTKHLPFFQFKMATGSDAFNDYACVTCTKQGLSSDAKSYCITCTKPYCTECLTQHNLFHDGHSVIGQDKIHQWGGVKKSVAMVMCDEHPDRETEIFCQGHDVVCCSLCIIRHRCLLSLYMISSDTS